MAALTSPIAWVISISRGQAMVQLKTVWQRYTPNWSFRMRRRSAPPGGWMQTPGGAAMNHFLKTSREMINRWISLVPS